ETNHTARGRSHITGARTAVSPLHVYVVLRDVTCVVSGNEAEVKRGEARAAHLSTGEEKTEQRKEGRRRKTAERSKFTENTHTVSPVGLFTCGFCSPVGLFTCWSVHLCFCSPVGLFTCGSVHLLVCSPVGLFTCGSVHLWFCSPVVLFTCGSVHLWVLFTCGSVHLWVFWRQVVPRVREEAVLLGFKALVSPCIKAALVLVCQTGFCRRKPPVTPADPLKHQRNPLETNQRNPLKHHRNPLKHLRTPCNTSITPCNTSRTPCNTSRTPHNPLKHQQKPLKHQQNPLKHQQNPLKHQQNPLGPTETPAEPPVTPTNPCNTNGTPVTPTEPPVTPRTPGNTSGTPETPTEPLKHQREPPETTNGTPCNTNGTPCNTSEPPETPTEPPVTPTEPPLTPAEPPVTPAEPPVTPAEPPVTPTEPPETPTEPPETTTEPPVNTNETPCNTNGTPFNTNGPPGNTNGPPSAELACLHKQSLGASSDGATQRVSVNNPIPSNLKSEAKKAAKILRDFTEISNRTGLTDRLIPPSCDSEGGGPRHHLRHQGRLHDHGPGGSGIVIARLGDRRWSAPSAIGIAGLGGGFEIGVERRAVDAFTKGGNLTLGGNCTVAVGPIGRNVEADVSIRSPAAVFTYCRSRGLFAGISLEGSGLIERKDTNRKFYGREIRASAILNGDVEPPPECYDLYHILDEYTDAYTADWTSKNMRPKSSGPPSRPSVPPQQKPSPGYQQPATTDKDSLYPSISETSGQLASRNPTNNAGGGASGELVVKATHPFTGQQPGDLSFVPGDSITVVTKTESQYDWWEGRHSDGRVGIFPANFVAF
ncbi:hypothetical protein KUCAC02_033658, partial [Chaenocephalus aceratus]